VFSSDAGYCKDYAKVVAMPYFNSSPRFINKFNATKQSFGPKNRILWTLAQNAINQSFTSFQM
jgi:hypothetical protein